MKKATLSMFMLVMFATLAVFAMPAAAQEVYLVPQSSSAAYGDTVDVAVWVNATNFQSGQINLTYDSTCANVTNFVRDSVNFPFGFWTHSVGGEWIGFTAAAPLTGKYMLGTLTIQCVCTDECSTILDFVSPSKLFDPSGSEVSGVTWADGTFSAIPPPKEVYLVPQSSSVSSGDTVDVEIWVDATNFQSGQINLTYDSTCANVTNWERSITTFSMGTRTHSVGGEWITFMSTSSLSGEYQIGTLTIQGVSEDACSTTLDFVSPSKLFNPSGSEISGVSWTDGTVTVTADTKAPVITNLQPADGSSTTDTTPTISASYSDSDSGINTSSVILTLDGVTVAATVTATGVTYTPTTALSYATHTVILSVSDNATNTAPKTWSFTVRRPPSGGGAPTATPAINVPIAPTTGEITSTISLTIEKAALTITEGIIVKDAAGNPLSTSITTLHTPSTAKSIGAIAAYDFGPSGTTFSKPIDLVIAYDPAEIPAGFSEKDLVVKMYDGTKWIDLPTTVDTAAHTATAKVSHFSIFALFAAKPAVTPIISTATATPTAAPTAAPNGKVSKVPWLIIGIIVAVIIVGAAAYYFYTKKKA